MRKIFRYIRMVFGWSFLYLAVSGAVGLVIQFQSIEIGLGCERKQQAFGLLEWSCDNKITENILKIALETPRDIITIPAISLALLGTGIKNYDLRTSSNSLPYLIVSIPFFVFMAIGTRYWWKNRRLFGVGGLILLIGDIVFLASRA